MKPDPEPQLPRLFEHHRAELLRFVAARTGDMAEAEDIVQELWLRASAAPAASVEHWRGYLFRAANNLVIDRVRARRRREAREREWTESVHGAAPVTDEVADRADTPDAAAEAAQEARRLARAVAALPQGARRVFELHKIDGLSHAEVADRLGISKSGVEKHMAVAMTHLRRALAD